MRQQPPPLLVALAVRLAVAGAAFTVQGSVYNSYTLRNVRGIAVSGTKLYAAFHSLGYSSGSYQSGLAIVSISSASSPSILGTYQSYTYLNGAMRVVVSGSYAFVSASSARRFTIVNVASSSSPSFKASLYDTYFSDVRGMAISPLNSNYVFMAARSYQVGHAHRAKF